MNDLMALLDERSESDNDLQRERKLVDATVNQIQHSIHVAPVLRRAIRELRGRLRRQRHDVDHHRLEARRLTDAALEGEQHHVDELEAAERTVRMDQVDARRALSAMLAEIDVIAASVHAIRMRSVDLPAEHDVFDLAAAIEVAADRVLELASGTLDPH